MLSDVMVSSFLLVSLRWSSKPPDEFHMFGHGRAQNVAALVSAVILISFMSFEAFREAIPRLFQTSYTGSQNSVLALIVISVGMLVIAVPTVDVLRTKTKGASLKAQMVGLLKDEISYAAILAGVLLVSQGYIVADTIASLFVASVIAVGGIYLLKDNVHYLVGRAPDQQFFKRLEATARSVQGVAGIHDLKAEYVGPNIIQASLHVEVEKGTPAEKADRIAHEVEEKVSMNVSCQYCVVHIDPADQ